jgi:opacity protein-like surface antigen
MKVKLAAVAAAICLAAPAAAQADSLVFVKGGNVWLSAPDGSGQYQVTTDGTADHPYRSPSQADDGTIAAGFGNVIVRMRQNGQVLNTIDPPAMLDSASDPVDGPPISVAISPDGSRIAYTMAEYGCPDGADCDTRTVTAYTAADHLTPPEVSGTTYLRNPSWVTNTRTLQFGGFTHQVDFHDVGQPSDVHWFDDADVVGQPNATDLGDGELNRQGTRLVLVRGYGDDATILWYDVSGNALSGAPPVAPSPLCVTGAEAGVRGPTWSPDGESLAMVDPDGIWVKRNAGSCDSPAPVLAVPGGSQPDWGPANVSPGPRSSSAPASPPSSPAAPLTPAHAHAGCSALKGSKRDTCVYKAAVAKCKKGAKGKRAKCLARAKRAYAIKRCQHSAKGKARARCIRKARRHGA